MTVIYSRECLTTVGGYLYERPTTVLRVSHDVHANFISVLFLAIKSQNGLIYVAYLSHCADRGNFLAMCL